MTTITIQEAQTRLSELIHRLTPGEEVVITENNQPVARLFRRPGQASHGKAPSWDVARQDPVHGPFRRPARRFQGVHGVIVLGPLSLDGNCRTVFDAKDQEPRTKDDPGMQPGRPRRSS